MTRISLTAAKALGAFSYFHIFLLLIAAQSISNARLKAARVTSITNIITALPWLGLPRLGLALTSVAVIK